MAKAFLKPESMFAQPMHYCPGCTHGVAHRLVAEVIDELGIRGRTVGIAPVGCAVLCYNYFTFDFQEAAHGRAPAMATGIKRVRPDLVVFTYQGDGDLASIGMSEIIHSANRGEKFTTIFINNAVYGRDKLATLFRQDIGCCIIVMCAGIVHCAVSDWKDKYRRCLRRGDIK